MGIQILPEAKSFGTDLGRAVGTGIQKGAEQGIQRGQVQNALGQLQNLPTNASPL